MNVRARAASALALAVAWLCVPTAVSHAAAEAPLRVVTTFAPGTLSEGLVADREGNLYADITPTGDIVKITPDGQQQLFASLGPAPLFTGMAFDAVGNLYVARVTFQADPPAAVFRITPDGTVSQLFTMQPFAFPNGLAFLGRDLLVSDSWFGQIWRVSPEGQATLWLEDPLIARQRAFGANGLALYHHELYVAVSDQGQIVRVPIEMHGEAGTPTIYAKRKKLAVVDGIAFDVAGDLYAATAWKDRLVELKPDGSLIQLAHGPDGLTYPTSPAFGTAPADRTTLYLTNAALPAGTPDIVALDVGVPGKLLP